MSHAWTLTLNRANNHFFLAFKIHSIVRQTRNFNWSFLFSPKLSFCCVWRNAVTMIVCGIFSTKVLFAVLDFRSAKSVYFKQTLNQLETQKNWPARKCWLANSPRKSVSEFFTYKSINFHHFTNISTSKPMFRRKKEKFPGRVSFSN